MIKTARQRTKGGTFLPSHGLAHTRIYNIWRGMKTRCYTPSAGSYSRYGAKGVRVCDEWFESFEAFYSWAINNGYKDDLTIDRIDNTKGYSPNNCRWVSPKEQSLNRRNVRMITYKGKTQCIAAWAKEKGIDKTVLLHRINAGIPLEEALEVKDLRSKYSGHWIYRKKGDKNNVNGEAGEHSVQAE